MVKQWTCKSVWSLETVKAKLTWYLFLPFASRLQARTDHFWLLGRAASGDGLEAHLKRPCDGASNCGYGFPNCGPPTSSAVGAPASRPIVFQGNMSNMELCLRCAISNERENQLSEERAAREKAWHNFRSGGN